MCIFEGRFADVDSQGFKVLHVRVAGDGLLGNLSEAEVAQATGALEAFLSSLFTTIPLRAPGLRALSMVVKPLDEKISGLEVFETQGQLPVRLLFSICPDCKGAILWGARRFNFATRKAS